VSTSEMMFYKEALYQVHVPLPLPYVSFVNSFYCCQGGYVFVDVCLFVIRIMQIR